MQSPLQKPRRRWLQFSLRSLFLLTLAITVAVVWPMYRAKQQKVAVAALQKVGCFVSYERPKGSSPTMTERLRSLLGEEEPRDVTQVNGHFTHMTDAEMAHVRGLSQLEKLALAGTKVTDDGLENIRGLTQLRILHLSPRTTNEGVANIRGLTQLRELSLSGTLVTDAGLAHVQGLKQLRLLHLYETQLTDAALVHLKGLDRLETLYLGKTLVTDAGMVHLQGLTQLRALDVRDTQVTSAGVGPLKDKLRSCAITYDLPAEKKR